MITLIRRTLNRLRTLVGVLSVMLIAFQAALVAIASTFVESGGFERLSGLVPAFVQQALGPALTSFAGMASLGFFEPLIVMLVVQVAIYIATEPAGDIEVGLVDLLLARPVPRHHLLTRSLIVMSAVTVWLTGLMAISLWMFLSLWAPPGAAWPSSRVVFFLAANLAVVSWCFGCAALAASAWTRRRSTAQGAIAVAAITAYLMEVVGEAWPRAIWASRLSPFHHFHGGGILSGEARPVEDMALLAGLGVVAAGLAYWKFQRRDL
jgi:hypothetical protein